MYPPAVYSVWALWWNKRLCCVFLVCERGHKQVVLQVSETNMGSYKNISYIKLRVVSQCEVQSRGSLAIWSTTTGECEIHATKIKSKNKGQRDLSIICQAAHPLVPLVSHSHSSFTFNSPICFCPPLLPVSFFLPSRNGFGSHSHDSPRDNSFLNIVHVLSRYSSLPLCFGTSSSTGHTHTHLHTLHFSKY